MDNPSRIQRLSNRLHILLSVLLVVVPLYYVGYWTFANHLPATLINVNTEVRPLFPHVLPGWLRFTGFAASMLPLAALCYGITKLRQLFACYKRGIIFSFEHVDLLRKTAGALVAWVVCSVVYEAARSVILSAGNAPGSRVLQVGFGSAELTTLVVGAVAFVIAWVMDEGRVLAEERDLTV